MLTKQERAEIAERLKDCPEADYYDFYEAVTGAETTLTTPTTQMSYEYGNGDNRTEEYMELIARSPEDTVACHCHTCNMVFRFERGIVPDYCPFCGARVVRDHDDA